MKLDTLDTTIDCPHCPIPIHLSVPVEIQAGVVLVVDALAVQRAVNAHLRQHE